MLIPAPESREQMSPSEPGWSVMSTVRQSSIEAYNPSFCSASLPFTGSSAMILARPSNTARARMFTLALPSDWATCERVPGLLASWTVNCLARGMSLPPEELSDQPKERIEIAVRHPFLERDDAIVGDLDVLGADLGAAARDVAEARPELPSDRGDPVVRVERVHLERRQSNHEARPDEGVLARLVAQDMADVLAQVALDALAELLHPVHVLLHHAVRPRGRSRPRPERRDPLVLLVIPGDVRHQILDDREGLHRLHGDDLAGGVLVHARHAGELRLPVDLHAAGPALPRLAVPPHRQVVGESRLDPVQDVQDDHAGIDVHAILDERTARRRAAPDSKGALRHVRPPGPRSWRRRSRPAPSAAPAGPRPASPCVRRRPCAPRRSPSATRRALRGDRRACAPPCSPASRGRRASPLRR